MKTPSKPATPPPTRASPPRTTPPTARSAGLRNRPSSAAPPRADRTANSPNKRIAQAPKEMGDHPLNMSAGTFADWNSICQNRSGRPRSIVRSAPERIAPQAATLYPLRTSGRSSGRPDHSTTPARQPVHLRLVHEQVERVEPAERAIRVCAVQLGLDAL